MKAIVSIAASAWLLASCRSDGWFISREVKRLEEWSEERLVEEYGEPALVHAGTVADQARAPEPDRPPAPQILALYPPAVAGNLDVPIRRLSWTRGRVLLTAWLHREGGRWRVLHAEEYNLDAME